MARPKVLFLHQGGELYGSDNFFLETIKALSPCVDPVIVLDNRGPLVDKLRGLSNNIAFRELGVLRRKFFNAGGAIKLFCTVVHSTLWLTGYIKRENIVLVYTNTIGILSGAIAAKLSGKPHIWHVQEIIVKPKWFWRFLSAATQRLSNKVIALSNSIATHLSQGWQGPSGKVTVVYGGTTVEPFDAAIGGKIRQEYGINKDTFVIGLVGRIHYWKGQDFLIEATYLMVQKGFTDFKVLIVGDVFQGYEWFLEQLKEKVSALGLEDRVIFAGYRSDIPEVVKDLDVMVVPSILPEPFGLVVLEGMAGAKPVITTNHGGTAEIVDDGVTGYLVLPGDIESLAGYLLQLAMNRAEREQMGRQGRARLDRMFSIQQYHTGIRDAVFSVMSKHPSFKS